MTSDLEGRARTKSAQDSAFVARDPAKLDALAQSPIAELAVKGLKAKAGDLLRAAKKK
ncbi:MAG: hypothetical protein Q8S33_10010 [Myxococcales bacterium]|nr:hypothetical protein [Myxococcales bacterium]